LKYDPKWKFEILAQNENLKYHPKMEIWNMTPKWKFEIWPQNENLKYDPKMKIDLFRLQNFWKSFIQKSFSHIDNSFSVPSSIPET